MSQNNSMQPIEQFYQGWNIYQQHLVKSVTGLTTEQLALQPAPHLRSIGMIVMHIIGARARWFHQLLGEGGNDLAQVATWDRQGDPLRTSEELVQGLETTWRIIQDCLQRWTPTDLAHVYEGERYGESYSLTRQWVVWHLLEHDLHHGGELSLTLGIHNLSAPDL